jgi:hypothetical protein
MVAEPGARLTTTGERRSNFAYDVRGRQVPSERAVPHWTAVHAAATKGWNHIIEFLAHNGAELEVRDANGRTPRDLASGDYEAKNLAGSLTETVALLDALIAERNASAPNRPQPRPIAEATAAVEAAK